MSLLRHELGRVALVLLLAFVARAAFVIWWHANHNPQVFEFPDSESYWDLGRDIADGDPYEFGWPKRRVFRAPGYPLILAAMFRAIGATASPAAARWLGVLIGTCTVGAVYCLARNMFDVRVAFFAAAIVALYPEAIATSVWPLSDGPFCLWMMLQLVLWHAATKAIGTRIWSLAIAAGVMAGVATLIRPSWLLFSPFFVALWAIASRFNRQQLSIGAVMLVGLVITMAPWWIRNWYVTGGFVPTTLWVGASLYDGLNPTATGGSDMRFVPAFEAQLQAEDAGGPPVPNKPPFEIRFDRMLCYEALTWTRANPVRALQLAGIKLGRMWNIWPNEPAFRSGWIRLGIAGTYIPLLVFAACGAWLVRQQTGNLLLLVSPAIYLSLLHAIFVGSLRYRQPALLPLAVLAAVGIDALWTRYVATLSTNRPT